MFQILIQVMKVNFKLLHCGESLHIYKIVKFIIIHVILIAERRFISIVNIFVSNSEFLIFDTMFSSSQWSKKLTVLY